MAPENVRQQKIWALQRPCQKHTHTYSLARSLPPSLPPSSSLASFSVFQVVWLQCSRRKCSTFPFLSVGCRLWVWKCLRTKIRSTDCCFIFLLSGACVSITHVHKTAHTQTHSELRNLANRALPSLLLLPSQRCNKADWSTHHASGPDWRNRGGEEITFGSAKAITNEKKSGDMGSLF